MLRLSVPAASFRLLSSQCFPCRLNRSLQLARERSAGPLISSRRQPAFQQIPAGPFLRYLPAGPRASLLCPLEAPLPCRAVPLSIATIISTTPYSPSFLLPLALHPPPALLCKSLALPSPPLPPLSAHRSAPPLAFPASTTLGLTFTHLLPQVRLDGEDSSPPVCFPRASGASYAIHCRKDPARQPRR